MLLLNVFQVSVWSTENIATILTISLSLLFFLFLCLIDKNAHHNVPEPKVTSFCLASSVQPTV